MDLTTHTSISPIQRGFPPSFVNNKKPTRLTAVSDKVYLLPAHGCWFSLGTPASSTTKAGSHDDIAELLLKLALKRQNSKSNRHWHEVGNRGGHRYMRSCGNIMFTLCSCPQMKGGKCKNLLVLRFRLMMFNATFNKYFSYWWMKQEYPEITTDLSPVTDELYHIMLCQVHLDMNGV